MSNCKHCLVELNAYNTKINAGLTCITCMELHKMEAEKKIDNINPSHYKSHPSGVECITITEHMNFCLGNAFKYIWRAGLKSESAVEDLKKAIWYIQQEIKRLERNK